MSGRVAKFIRKLASKLTHEDPGLTLPFVQAGRARLDHRAKGKLRRRMETMFAQDERSKR